jgi:hypothetical protein
MPLDTIYLTRHGVRPSHPPHNYPTTMLQQTQLTIYPHSTA